MKQIENPLSPTSFLQPWPGWKLCCICTKQRMYLFKFTKKNAFFHHFSPTSLFPAWPDWNSVGKHPDCVAQSCVSERKSLQTFSSFANQLAKHDTQFVILSTVPRCALYSNASLIDRVDTGQGYSAWNATISHCSLSHYTVWGDANVPTAAPRRHCSVIEARHPTAVRCHITRDTNHPWWHPLLVHFSTLHHITLHYV